MLSCVPSARFRRFRLSTKFPERDWKHSLSIFPSLPCGSGRILEQSLILRKYPDTATIFCRTAYLFDAFPVGRKDEPTLILADLISRLREVIAINDLKNHSYLYYHICRLSRPTMTWCSCTNPSTINTSL